MTKGECILVVEDDPNDVFLLRYAFGKAEFTRPLMHASDGQEAIDYLAGHARYADRQQYPMPRLMLLDLKLPAVSGIEVLKWIAGRPDLNSLQVLVLSSSDHDRDVEESKRCGAQAFLVKPIGNDERVRLARLIKECWFEGKRPLSVQKSRSLSESSDHVVFVAGPRIGRGPAQPGASS